MSDSPNAEKYFRELEEALATLPPNWRETLRADLDKATARVAAEQAAKAAEFLGIELPEEVGAVLRAACAVAPIAVAVSGGNPAVALLAEAVCALGKAHGLEK